MFSSSLLPIPKARQICYLFMLAIIFVSGTINVSATQANKQANDHAATQTKESSTKASNADQIKAFNVDQIKAFNVEKIGNGKPMILIPGLASAGEVWHTTAEHYRANYQCHILTLSGFAGQPAVNTTAFTDTAMQAIADYIKTEKLDRPVIVGHSLGGVIALKLAINAPELIGQIIIVDSLPCLAATIAPGSTLEVVKPQAEQMRKIIAEQTPEQWKAYSQNTTVLKTMITDAKNVDRAAKWVERSDPKTVGQAMYEAFMTDLRDELPRIKSSTLVIGTWRGKEMFTTRENTEKIFIDQYAKLSNCKVLLADNARHFVMLDDPNWLFQQMDQFLKYQAK